MALAHVDHVTPLALFNLEMSIVPHKLPIHSGNVN